MKPLHADDPVGTQAFKATPYADAVGYSLLVASSARCTPQQRQEAMVRLAKTWPILCREMTALLDMAPRSTQAANEVMGKVADFLEARGQ